MPFPLHYQYNDAFSVNLLGGVGRYALDLESVFATLLIILLCDSNAFV